MAWSGGQRWRLPFRRLQFLWLLGLLPLFLLQDTRLVDAQIRYDRARQFFIHGDLEKSQHEAERGYEQLRTYDLTWASKFQLLAAESMLQRGMYNDALRALDDAHFNTDHPDLLIRKLAIEGVALLRQQQLFQAEQKLSLAADLCKTAAYESCGEVLQARGIFAAKQDNFSQARSLFLDTHAFAQAHHEQYLDASAELNLGWIALQADQAEEALDWLVTALHTSTDLGAEDLIEKSSGNLGWSYYKLGDSERALDLFLDAEKSASRRGSIRSELGWNSTIGYAYRDVGDLNHASQFYRRALYLARQINSKEDTVNTLEDLTHLSIDSGRLDEASTYLDELKPLMAANSARLDTLDVMLARGRIAAARHQHQQAEELLRAVEDDQDSQTSLRLDAEYELAKLYELEGNVTAADRGYRTALAAYELARATLKNEDSKLPFGANATRIYDSYIHLLMQQGKTEAALATADESRARTLEQGSGSASGTSAFRPAEVNPRQIAQRADATLLFYWLGDKQSYLWTITAARIAAFPLPPRQEIAGRVQSYRKAILGLRDTQRYADENGQVLYKLLIAPAMGLIDKKKPVIVLADGELSELNLETLLVPGPGEDTYQDSGRRPEVHYLVDDMTFVSAPSLAMLAMPEPARDRGKRLLLLGNPVSPSDNFPSLPLFGFEMSRIESHFAKGQMSIFAGQQATPATYLASNPSQYSYIHFVSHAIANRADPLDSAIVLSRSAGGEDSFKLYARDIIKHPIDAKLVTISACYGSGTRFFAGEGLVGLSWAFLRAGAQRVIGALWEVSDESTPRLMDSLYRSLEEGYSPAVSLRKAKLTLLHSQGRYSLPFYWATFQIYDRQ